MPASPQHIDPPLATGGTTGTPVVRYVSIWRRLKPDHRAVTALEYGLIAGTIVATVMLGFNILVSAESAKFSSVGVYL